MMNILTRQAAPARPHIAAHAIGHRSGTQARIPGEIPGPIPIDELRRLVAAMID